MAQVSAPLPANARQLSDSEYESVVAGYSEDGLIDGLTNQPPIFADGTALAVKVQPNRWAVLRAYLWYTDGAGDTVALQTADATARTDLVVLRLDRSTWAVSVQVVKGTPGSGAPAATRDTGDVGVYEIPLAEVDVAANATTIAASAVRTKAWFLSRNGTIICTSSTRPPTAPARRIFETDTTFSYEGTGYGSNDWRVTAEDTGWISRPFAGSNWTSDAGPAIRRKDGFLTIRLGDLTKQGQLNSNDDSHIIDLPTGFQTTWFHRTLGWTTGGGVGVISIYPSGQSGGRANQIWLVTHPTIPDGGLLQCADVTYPL